MSGIGEGIAAGLILEVLQTCYAYGRKWLENYRRASEYKVQDAEEMENEAASGSEEDRNYIERLWETAKKEVSKAKERVAYSVVGRDRTKKVFRMVEEWIGKIDDLVGYRATLILLKQNTPSGIFTEHVQRLDLPNTRNQIGLLLTNSTTLPLNVERDSYLNPGVTVFARRSVTLIEPVDVVTLSATSSSSSVQLPSSATDIRQSSRYWARFAPEAMSNSPTSVIIEFK